MNSKRRPSLLPKTGLRQSPMEAPNSSLSALGGAPPPARASDEPWPVHVMEWMDFVQRRRVNGLLVASADVAETILDGLRPMLKRPVVECREGPHWHGRRIATLLMPDLIALSPTDQASLLAWMDTDGGRCQVISFASLPPFPLVEQGRFLPSLYYRLNCVYADYLAA
jgi:hypothetical protein